MTFIKNYNVFFNSVVDYIKNHLNEVDDRAIRAITAYASSMTLGNSLDIYATEYSVLSENDLLREPGQNWSPSKNIVKDLRYLFAQYYFLRNVFPKMLLIPFFNIKLCFKICFKNALFNIVPF